MLEYLTGESHGRRRKEQRALTRQWFPFSPVGLADDRFSIKKKTSKLKYYISAFNAIDHKHWYEIFRDYYSYGFKFYREFRQIQSVDAIQRSGGAELWRCRGVEFHLPEFAIPQKTELYWNVTVTLQWASQWRKTRCRRYGRPNRKRFVESWVFDA